MSISNRSRWIDLPPAMTLHRFILTFEHACTYRSSWWRRRSRRRRNLFWSHRSEAMITATTLTMNNGKDLSLTRRTAASTSRSLLLANSLVEGKCVCVCVCIDLSRSVKACASWWMCVYANIPASRNRTIEHCLFFKDNRESRGNVETFKCVWQRWFKSRQGNQSKSIVVAVVLVAWKSHRKISFSYQGDIKLMKIDCRRMKRNEYASSCWWG